MQLLQKIPHLCQSVRVVHEEMDSIENRKCAQLEMFRRGKEWQMTRSQSIGQVWREGRGGGEVAKGHVSKGCPLLKCPATYPAMERRRVIVNGFWH